MSDVKGLDTKSPFLDLLGDPPISDLLNYVHQSWLEYARLYGSAPPSFSKRTEPQLTQGLAAYLRELQDAGKQPFFGDFFGELSSFVIDQASGLPRCIARTDIEWRLFGTAAFVIEFKILDGKSKRREKYLQDGVMRFVLGRYSSAATAGAMFALLRKAASKDPPLILTELQVTGTALQCGTVDVDSKLLPTIAAFDSTHQRHPPHRSPFRLAHLFAQLP